MATTHLSRVITPEADQDSYLADLLGYALQDDAPYLWLITDYVERRDLMRGYFVYELGLARRRGWLLRTFADHDGLAVWAHCSADPDGPPLNDPILTEVLGARWSEAVTEFEEARHTHRVHAMQGREHVHLRTLCARYQRATPTVETALLRERLAELDHQNLPVYADPSRTDLRNLLEDAGFRPVEGPPAASTAATVYPMVREPAPA